MKKIENNGTEEGGSVGAITEEGEWSLKMARTYSLEVVNTFFTQTQEKLISYKSGRNATVTDYMTVRRRQLGRVRNCRVIPGEAIATQHRLLMCDSSHHEEKKEKRQRNRAVAT